ncbi:MAG: type II CRISPR-associated endonuclease Cas1 [Magnetospirillum sp. WYHS-4]
MPGRFVEIAEDNRHLAVERGFLVVTEKGRELGRVPLDDIAALIANAHGLTYSNNALLELARRGAPVVLCGPHHRPEAFLWPVDGHHVQAARMDAQIAAPQPLRKRLWQGLVKAKVQMQGAILEARGQPAGAFEALAREVRSGDPDNIEAQAARRYWPLLMGADFRRDPQGSEINGLLNYGYTVLRAATARAVMGAGLHPTLGLFHSNRGNPMRLVDDLMEPFRPLVDLAVVRLADGGRREVDRDSKRILAGLSWADLPTAEGRTPLAACLERLALSVARSFESGSPELDLPDPPPPLDLAAWGESRPEA